MVRHGLSLSDLQARRRLASLEDSVVDELFSLFERQGYPLRRLISKSSFFESFRGLGYGVRYDRHSHEGGLFVVTGDYTVLAVPPAFASYGSEVGVPGTLACAYMSFVNLAQNVRRSVDSGALDGSFKPLANPGLVVNSYKRAVREHMIDFHEEVFPRSPEDPFDPGGEPSLLGRVVKSDGAGRYFRVGDGGGAAFLRRSLVCEYLRLFGERQGVAVPSGDGLFYRDEGLPDWVPARRAKSRNL
ncbi:MAG: hypothetical protein ACLFO2_03075 [Candidatus Woesearchaeota archaeon]